MKFTGISIIRKYKWSILWTCFILLLSFLPKSSFPNISFSIHYLDKIVHFCFYFILIFLLQFELGKSPSKILIINSLAFSVSVGVITEFGQKYFLGGRSFEIWDIVTNIIGSFIGLIFFRILKPLL